MLYPRYNHTLLAVFLTMVNVAVLGQTQPEQKSTAEPVQSKFVPAEIVWRPPATEYPPLAQSSGIEAELYAEVTVDTHGRPLNFRITHINTPTLTPNGALLSNEAIIYVFGREIERYMLALRFSPARDDGKPVQVIVEIPQKFVLEDVSPEEMYSEELKQALAVLNEVSFDVTKLEFPSDSTGFLQRAVTLGRLGKIDLVMPDVEAAIAVDPNNDRAYLLRGLLRLRENDFDDALADVNNAVRINPMSFVHLAMRGSIFVIKNDYDRALLDLDAALAIKPDLAEIYLHRGLIHYFKGQKDKALSDLRMVTRLPSSLRIGAEIWLYLLQTEPGPTNSVVSELLAYPAATPEVTEVTWETLVFNVILGKIKPEMMLELMTHPFLTEQINRLCIAHQLLGKWYHNQGQNALARNYYSQALSECPVHSIVYALAKREFDQLSPGRDLVSSKAVLKR